MDAKIFDSIFGEGARAELRELPPLEKDGPSGIVSKLEAFFSSKNSREKYLHAIEKGTPLADGTSCPGGLCQNGKCIPFAKILSSQNDGGICSWEGVGNGTSCDPEGPFAPGSFRGNCYEGECLVCEAKTELKLRNAPECPEHPLSSKLKGNRKSCRHPDVCQYRPRSP